MKVREYGSDEYEQDKFLILNFDYKTLGKSMNVNDFI